MEPELEKLLKKLVKAQKKGRSTRDVAIAARKDAVQALKERGYIECDLGLNVEVTVTGRGYHKLKHRETRFRWLPVIVAAIIGAVTGGLFSLAGVVLGWQLGGGSL